MATAVAAAKTARAAANGGNCSFSPLPGGGFTRLRWLPPGPVARDGRAAILEERRPRLAATCAPIGRRRGCRRLVTVSIAPARGKAEAGARQSTWSWFTGFLIQYACISRGNLGQGDLKCLVLWLSEIKTASYLKKHVTITAKGLIPQQPCPICLINTGKHDKKRLLYPLRHKNIEIIPTNNTIMASKYSSEMKSQMSLTFNQKLEMIKLREECMSKAKIG
ncbi:PREDICTED: uncharacterized protein LOC108540831 [Rhinopithecus bieti]|uniref:uncharacterized protein LOC108540831 n=1 Tax=Rhinopithecus bieti TaxID=61621 RepID=UPI00083C4B7B|nr:PREDICTED: uncharacterized protein LOC108540831 [Rhinopithecus bieti]